jgi:hypothetical protein
MANRFWVGGSATWDATVGTKWAATSGGAGGQTVPTAADDVFLDASSGAGTVTTSSTSVCRSITSTSFTGTLSLANSATALTIGDASGGAMVLVSGMTLTIGGTSCVINFVSTSNNGGTGWGVTTGGKTMPGLTFNGAGGKWVFQDNMTASGGTAIITVTAGTLDTNSKTINCNTFTSSNSNTRSITFGTSAITCTGNDTAFSFSVETNLTFSGASSTITLNGPRPTIFTGNTLTFGTINLTGSGIGQLACNNTTVANFNRTGTAAQTDGVTFSIGSLTITGTLTLAGNSSTNRLLVQSDALGTRRTLTCNGTVNASNVDFLDIGGGGSASWNLSATTGGSGDCQGNLGITFTTGQTNFWVGGTGNWNDAANHWASTSGGAVGTGRIPLPQDTARLDANSGSGTATVNMPRFCKDLDCTGYTGTFTRTGSFSVWSFGSLTLGSGMTLTQSGIAWLLMGRSSHAITTNGKAIPLSQNFNLAIWGFGGTYTLQDDLTVTGTTPPVFLVHGYGTFNANGKNVTVPNFFSNYTAAQPRTLTMGTGTWTLTETGSGTAAIWFLASTGMTVNGSQSQIVISAASPLARSFGGAGFTYNNLTISGDGGVSSALTITGANTFSTISTGPGVLLTLPSSTTTTISGLSPSVSNYGYVYLPGVNGNYLSSPDSVAVSNTGDIDLRCRMALDLWSPTSQLDFFSKWASVSQASWTFYLINTQTDKLNFAISTTGSNSLGVTSSVGTGFSAAALRWVRVTRRQSDGRVQFFTSSTNTNDPSAVSWIQLGTDQTLSSGSAMFDSTSIIEIGSVLTGTLSPSGKYYRMQVRNNILDNGTGIVFDSDLTQLPFGSNSFNESSTNRALVTLNGAQAMAGDGRFSLAASTSGTQATLSKSSGTVSIDYASIKDSNATGGATFYAGSHSNSVSNNSGWIFPGLPGGWGLPL